MDMIDGPGSVLTGRDSVLTAAGNDSNCPAPIPPATCQPAGTVIYDSGVIAAEHTVNSNLAVGANSWIEIPGVPFAGLNPSCNFKIIVSMDAHDTHAGVPTDDFIINAFVSPAGAVIATDIDSLAVLNVGAGITLVYASYTLFPGTDTFAGGTAAGYSVYIWPGVNFPDFQGSQVQYKNLRIVIQAA